MPAREKSAARLNLGRRATVKAIRVKNVVEKRLDAEIDSGLKQVSNTPFPDPGRYLRRIVSAKPAKHGPTALFCYATIDRQNVKLLAKRQTLKTNVAELQLFGPDPPVAGHRNTSRRG